MALRRTLYVLAVIPIVAGCATLALGSGSVPDPGSPSANLESELRFYSVWWLGAGLFVLWLAPRVGERRLELRVFCALLFLAGLSRLAAAADTDWPSSGQLALMAVELALPPVLVVWQARAARPRGSASAP